MSLLQWPAGWRFPGHVEPAPPRPQAEPVHAARALAAEDLAAIYGPRPGILGRNACVAGHDLVTWHGEDPCFACGGPGLRRDVS